MDEFRECCEGHGPIVPCTPSEEGPTGAVYHCTVCGDWFDNGQVRIEWPSRDAATALAAARAKIGELETDVTCLCSLCGKLAEERDAARAQLVEKTALLSGMQAMLDAERGAAERAVARPAEKTAEYEHLGRAVRGTESYVHSLAEAEATKRAEAAESSRDAAEERVARLEKAIASLHDWLGGDGDNEPWPDLPIHELRRQVRALVALSTTPAKAGSA